MQEGDRFRGNCPNCGEDKWIYAQKIFSQKFSDGLIDIYLTHIIAECKSCDEVVYVKQSANSEVYDINDEGHIELEVTQRQYPDHAASDVTEPDWVFKLFSIDETLYSVTSQTYVALSSGQSMFAAIGFRTIFDYAAVLLGANADLPFESKLNKLVSIGKISQDERSHIDAMIQGGSASIHRAWQPQDSDVQIFKNVTEAFLYRNFVLGDEVKKVIARIPPRMKKP